MNIEREIINLLKLLKITLIRIEIRAIYFCFAMNLALVFPVSSLCYLNLENEKKPELEEISGIKKPKKTNSLFYFFQKDENNEEVKKDIDSLKEVENFLTRLGLEKEEKDETNREEIRSFIKNRRNPLEGVNLSGEKWENLRSKRISSHSFEPIEKNNKFKNWLILESSGDGNCLLNSISILLAGDKRLAVKLREALCLLMMKEAADNEENSLETGLLLVVKGGEEKDSKIARIEREKRILEERKRRREEKETPEEQAARIAKEEIEKKAEEERINKIVEQQKKDRKENEEKISSETPEEQAARIAKEEIEKDLGAIEYPDPILPLIRNRAWTDMNIIEIISRLISRKISIVNTKGMILYDEELFGLDKKYEHQREWFICWAINHYMPCIPPRKEDFE